MVTTPAAPTKVGNGKAATGRALVTGASSGIGAEFARCLAAQGKDLILVARREDTLDALAQTLRTEHGVTVSVIACDLSATDAADQLFARTHDAGLHVDLLVNNAGFGIHGHFSGQDPDALTRMLQLNVSTLTRLTRLYLTPMIEQGQGQVIQVGSVGSFQPGPLFAAYAATKAYVLSFGEAINFELRGTGVTCTVVCPGVTRTEFLDAAGQNQKLSLYQKLFMMDAPDVARIGLRAAERGRPVVVTGALNKVQIFCLRLVSRRFATMAGYWGLKLD